jgi:hypothetical protein
MSGSAKRWLTRTGIVMLVLLVIVVGVGMVVMYLDFVQFAHDFTQTSDARD